MASTTAMEGRRPYAPDRSQSFTRLESPQSPLSRSRASTLQDDARAGKRRLELATSPLDENRRLDQDDVFEKDPLMTDTMETVKDVGELDSPNEVPADFDQLPIELISMIDRFIESLGAKVHNTPPSIEKLSDIYQDFYVKAEALIATHISALSTRQSQGGSPNPSISSKASSKVRDGTKLRSSSSKDTLGSLSSIGSEQQMLTPQEIQDRRKARRMLDRKRVALEEAVERRVCERVYNRIWRHRSTLDEVRDEKLRSRTAALALVGIGLRDLGIDLDVSSSEAKTEVEEWISKARAGLLRMNDAKHPLGKLQQLAVAHKTIVDLLTALHQSSSSADEILPTLIYTLITTPPEGINVISNLHFIQRFRAASKVDGEAAYCLVNLEAAITFLETVDLTSLRSDEPPEGPPRPTSRSSTPYSEIRTVSPERKSNAASTSSPSSTPINAPSPPAISNHPLQTSHLPDTPEPTPSSHHRKLSNLFQPPASALGAAGDAVLSTADQGFRTIGNTLDNSFQLLFGRLQEQKVAGNAAGADGSIIVPKTLDDARKLVEPKSEDEEDVTSTSMTPLGNDSEEQVSSSPKNEDNLLSAIAGRKQPRDRSVDSLRSSGSGKKTTFAAEKPAAANPSSNHHGNAAVESMLSIGNSLNPLKGFGGLSMRGFGVRNSSGGPTSAPTPTFASVEEAKGMSAALSEGSGAKITPPIQRFMEVGTSEDLKIGDIAELLSDYKRLAGALKDMKAF